MPVFFMVRVLICTKFVLTIRMKKERESFMSVDVVSEASYPTNNGGLIASVGMPLTVAIAGSDAAMNATKSTRTI